MKKRYSSPMTKTIVVTSSPILQGSRALAPVQRLVSNRIFILRNV